MLYPLAVKVAESSPVKKGVLMPNAIMAKFGNAIDLAKKIKMLINLRNAMAIETRHELEEKYSWAILRQREL
jgi:hypothetical protein